MKWKQKDIFSRTGQRLTLFYSAILSLFLILFVGIVLFILYSVILGDQERRINTIADQEMKEIQKVVEHPKKRNQWDDKEPVYLSENQLFYYVTDRSGNVLLAQESFTPLRPRFLELISKGKTNENETRQITLKMPKNQPEFRQFRDIEITVYLLSRPIFLNGQYAGMMYIGLDITYFNNIFKWVVIILSSLAILFIGVAVWLSHLMSKKALIPIKNSYNQQREFIANASHELRTPLSVIYSSIEALELDDEKKDPFTQKIMSGLKNEVKRMTKLINNLLTLARSDSEETKHELTKEWVDFYPHIEKVVQSFERIAYEKQIELKVQSQASIRIYADSDKLIQLLYILLDNAIKYTPNGGEVALEFSTRIHKNSGLFIMSVKDSGFGIMEEDKNKIFDRFYRVDKARNRKAGGFGLGLSIAKWIVDAHKGQITVRSEAGKGTEFIVEIPYGK